VGVYYVLIVTVFGYFLSVWALLDLNFHQAAHPAGE
jgi:hypothetical protein